jgi:hypothetical protein
MTHARRRFRRGWGLAWGLTAVVVALTAGDGSSGTSVTVHAIPPMLSDAQRLLAQLAGCALAAGLGVAVAFSGLALSKSDRRWNAVMWAAIAAATAAANWYLAGHNGPDWWYRTVSINPGEGAFGVTTHTEFRNPWMVHLALTLPVAGAAGGIVQCLATTGAARRAARAFVWGALWAAAFLIARYVGVITVYLGGGAAIDLFEVLGLPPDYGKAVGVFAGGYLTGLIVGSLLAMSPGLAWAEPPARADAP